MISKGTIVLMQTIKKYVTEKCIMLATYVLWLMKNSIQRDSIRSYCIVYNITTSALNNECSFPASRLFIETTSFSLTSSFLAISLTCSFLNSPSDLGAIWFFIFFKLQNNFFCAVVVPIFTNLHYLSIYS